MYVHILKDYCKEQRQSHKDHMNHTEGQRIADVSQDLLTSEDRIRGIADAGLPGMTDAMDRVRQGMDFKARQFTGDEVSKYMSPYMDQVVARQKQSAIDDYRQQLAGGRADAIAQEHLVVLERVFREH